GGMGGAQPLAVTMAGGVVIGIDVDRTRIEKRIETKYCDTVVESVADAITLAEDAKRLGKALSIGLVGNAAEILPEMIERGFIPDIVTDQTSAHDPLNGYLPIGVSLAEGERLRNTNPNEYIKQSKASMAIHVQAMLEMQRKGAVAFDYGNNIRQVALDEGVTNAFDFPG
ncbi:urocanate hydratase, partial [Priestia megaterium]